MLAAGGLSVPVSVVGRGWAAAGSDILSLKIFFRRDRARSGWYGRRLKIFFKKKIPLELKKGKNREMQRLPWAIQVSACVC